MGDSDLTALAAYVPRVVAGDVSAWQELIAQLEPLLLQLLRRSRTLGPLRRNLDDCRTVMINVFDRLRRDEDSGRLLASFDSHADSLLGARFSPDGTRVITAGRDGSSWISDVHLEQRTPDAIRHIISAHDPWMLANSVLVPAEHIR